MNQNTRVYLSLWYLKSVILLLLLLSSCSKHYPAPVHDINNNQKPKLLNQKKYPYSDKSLTKVRVKKGDSLYSIGFSHSIDYKLLASINNIKAPYRIYPGQELSLIAKKTVTPTNKVKTTAIKLKPRIKSHTKPIKINQQKPSVINTKSKTNATVKHTKPTNVTRTKPTIVKSKPIQQPAQAPQSNSRWIWPVQGRVISTFSNANVSRKGIDIAVKLKHSVVAANNGVVVYSGDGLRGYGELIILKHSNNLLSAYAHNSKRLVKEGDKVSQGQTIAKSGKGTDGRELLHFEIRKNGQPVNPLNYLPKK